MPTSNQHKCNAPTVERRRRRHDTRPKADLLCAYPSLRPCHNG
jgi:hypothetical protein